MIRRTCMVSIALAALFGVAPQADAQLTPGIHVVRAADAFGGSNGIGVSAELSAPLFPVSVFVAGDYFFPDCGTVDGCSYSGGSADLHFSLPGLIAKPYASAGVVYRRTVAGSGMDAVSNTGFGVGAGVSLGTLVLGAYGEVRYEFVDPDDQVVIRLGLRF